MQILEEPVFQELNKQLHKIHPDLIFLVGRLTETEFQFLISADGNRSLVDAVRTLRAMAPTLPHWSFVAFHQPMTSDRLKTTKYTFQGNARLYEIKLSEIRTRIGKQRVWQGENNSHGLAYDVHLYLPLPFTEEQESILLTILETTLGELMVMDRVAIPYAHPLEAAPPDALSLSNLQNCFAGLAGQN